MNYIYDILLNFKDKFYDFYEWNKNDNIIHVRKIPIFRINTDDLYNMQKYNIKFDISFLENIENITEIFTNKGIKKIKYACLFSDGESIIGINIIQKKVKVSSLLIDEELDSLEDVYTMNVDNIKYIIQDKKETNEFKTRKQVETKNYLNKELTKIKNDEEKLKYLYYECFNIKENDTNKIMLELKLLDDDIIINKICEFLNLIRINSE